MMYHIVSVQQQHRCTHTRQSAHIIDDVVTAVSAASWWLLGKQWYLVTWQRKEREREGRKEGRKCAQKTANALLMLIYCQLSMLSITMTYQTSGIFTEQTCPSDVSTDDRTVMLNTRLLIPCLLPFGSHDQSGHRYLLKYFCVPL